MKSLNYLSLVLLFAALSFSVQAMDPPKAASNTEKSSDKDEIPSIIEDYVKQESLQTKLLAYTKHVTNDQLTMGGVGGKKLLAFTIGYEFWRGKCGNALMFILQIIAGQASTNKTKIKKVVRSVKEQRADIIRTTKDDPYLYALLLETKHQNKNRAVAAYFYLIEYILASPQKAAKLIQNPPEFIIVKVPGTVEQADLATSLKEVQAEAGTDVNTTNVNTTDLITPSPAPSTPKNRDKKSHPSRKAKTLD